MERKEIEKVVKQVMKENKPDVKRIANPDTDWKTAQYLHSFILGQVMKKTQGKANPKTVNIIIEKALSPHYERVYRRRQCEHWYQIPVVWFKYSVWQRNGCTPLPSRNAEPCEWTPYALKCRILKYFGFEQQSPTPDYIAREPYHQSASSPIRPLKGERYWNGERWLRKGRKTLEELTTLPERTIIKD